MSDEEDTPATMHDEEEAEEEEEEEEEGEEEEESSSATPAVAAMEMEQQQQEEEEEDEEDSVMVVDPPPPPATTISAATVAAMVAALDAAAAAGAQPTTTTTTPEQAGAEGNQVLEEQVAVFAQYRPSIDIGQPHPSPVVESGLLAGVSLPSLEYDHDSIPPDTIASGKLSSLQLEAIAYAGQRHRLVQSGTRAGFFLGDSTVRAVCTHSHTHTRTCTYTHTHTYMKTGNGQRPPNCRDPPRQHRPRAEAGTVGDHQWRPQE